MSEPLLSIVEGWTKPLLVTLQTQASTDTSPSAFDLTGFTAIQIVLKTADGVTVKDTSTGISVTATTAGQLSYTPSTSTGDLFLAAKSPYRMRFRITDAIGAKEYWPNDEERLIEVNPV